MSRWQLVRTRLTSVLGPVARPVALAGAAVLAIACFLPWSQYAGFPGKMLNTIPGGARLYLLLLCLPALTLLRPVPGRARAVRITGTFALVLAVLTMLFIAYAGGGIVNVGYGAFVGSVGAIGYALGAQALQGGDQATVRSSPPSLPDASWRLPVEVGVIVTSTVVEHGARSPSGVALLQPKVNTMWCGGSRVMNSPTITG